MENLVANTQLCNSPVSSSSPLLLVPFQGARAMWRRCLLIALLWWYPSVGLGFKSNMHKTQGSHIFLYRHQRETGIDSEKKREHCCSQAMRVGACSLLKFVLYLFPILASSWMSLSQQQTWPLMFWKMLLGHRLDNSRPSAQLDVEHMEWEEVLLVLLE